uniref:Uncharacterized protein n=1 Tax=Timema genevievae TaxID=629358 RepID=A0A7R9PQL3_TIMGE|nr:unnamed protein product [Timema genevievae]
MFLLLNKSLLQEILLVLNLWKTTFTVVTRHLLHRLGKIVLRKTAECNVSQHKRWTVFISFGQFRLTTAIATFSPSQRKIDNELSLHLENPVSPLKANLFQVWDDMNAVLPSLFKLDYRSMRAPLFQSRSRCTLDRAGFTLHDSCSWPLEKDITLQVSGLQFTLQVF